MLRFGAKADVLVVVFFEANKIVFYRSKKRDVFSDAFRADGS